MNLLLLFAPGVFLADLFFFSRCEIVLDVESLADFIWSFSFDHVCDCLARDVQQASDVQVVCGQDELEECALIDLEKRKKIRIE